MINIINKINNKKLNIRFINNFTKENKIIPKNKTYIITGIVLKTFSINLITANIFWLNTFVMHKLNQLLPLW